MRNVKLSLVHAAIVMAFTPIIVNAASLGKLTINSNVGEPLNAEIELIATAKDDLSSITASIATDETYSLQGMQRSPLLKDVRLDFGRKTDGTAILRLATKQPVNTSSLDMLIVFNNIGGRALNEYTLYIPQAAPKPVTPTILINTPVAEQQVATPPTPVVSKDTPEQQNRPVNKVKAPTTPTPTNTVVVETVVASTMAKPVVAATGSASNIEHSPSNIANKNSEHIVKPGESLNRIANKIPLQEFSFQQLLVGLFVNNKSAFDGDNMNRLHAGRTITTPSPNVIQAIPENEAVQTIAEHTQAYNEWRQNGSGKKLSNYAAGKIRRDEAVLTLTAPISTVAMKPVVEQPHLETKTSVNTTQNQANIVAASSAPTPTPVQTKPDNIASAKVIAINDDAVAQTHEIDDSQLRIAALEKQIKDMQTLLAMKSQMVNSIDPLPVVEKKHGIDVAVDKAKDNPLFAGGLLGGLGILSFIGFTRRKKAIKSSIVEPVDDEIEREMNSIDNAKSNDLGRPGGDLVD